MSNEIDLYKMQDMIRCHDNMKNLRLMMQELKGIVAMVRPQVKKSGWYGEEIETDKINPIELKLLQ